MTIRIASSKPQPRLCASVSKTFALGALAAALLAMPAVPASAATSPGIACQEGIAKTLAKCVKKAVALHGKCYKDVDADCAADNSDLQGAYGKAVSGTSSKCATNQAVADAGYGPYDATIIGTWVADQCKWESQLVADRTFGSTGAHWSGTDADGQKCLQNATKSAAKLLSGSIGGLAKCAPTGCTFDFTTAASDAATALDGKCPTFLAIVGTDTATYMSATTAQVAQSVQSPCDALDTTRCMMPFPNDFFTIADASQVTGRRIALGRKTLPPHGAALLDPTRWNEADGWSIGPMLMMNNPSIDLTQTGAAPITDIAQSLNANAPVIMIDASNGEQQMLWVERDQRASNMGADTPAIIVRVAKDLKEGHRYIIAFRHMKDAMGVELPAPANFVFYRDNAPLGTVIPLEARRAHMESIFSTLTTYGITRGSLYLAWDFTTQSTSSVSKRLLAMRDDATTRLAGGVPAFTVDHVTTNPNSDIFREIDGTFQVPLYLHCPPAGPAFNDQCATNGDPGSILNTGADGLPVASGSYTASYRCEIPHAATTGDAAPAQPARPSLYGHGLLGSHTEVDSGNVEDMAQEHNFLFCATDWTGFADDDQEFVAAVLGSFSRFPNFIDRQHQGMINQIYLGKLLLNPTGFASDANFQLGGTSMIDDTELYYDGNSQGGILGGVLGAIEQDITRFSLGVPGMNYSTLLNRSSDFGTFDAVLIGSYPLSTDRELVLSLAQLIWDRTDPNGHINHLLSNTYDANTPAKKALYSVAYGDHQVSPVTVEIAARTNGMSIHTPTIINAPTRPDPNVTPYYGIPAIPSYPFDGSAMVVWDFGNPAPPTGNEPPPVITPSDPGWSDLGPCPQGHGSDPHSCPRSDVDNRTQKSEFLKPNGAIVDVCSGAPCSQL
ncbi:MAG TPA: hypothetical protein VGK20_17030 [Candidatus Binatia bacterium]|jgi:hypothetical protein